METRVIGNTLNAICLLLILVIFSRCVSLGPNGLAFDPRQLVPEPYYGYKYLPDASRPGKAQVTGADFSQVYFSARALQHGESAYLPRSAQFKDRFNRLPNYPPLTNHLYRPIAGLGYVEALAIHNAASFLLLVLATALVMLRLGLGRYLWQVCGIYLLLYLCTPLGQSHQERGQFDLLVAVSYLMLFCSLFDRRAGTAYGAMAGLAGALKWSSFPFLGTFGLFALADRKGHGRWPVLVAFSVILLSILCFLPGLKEYMVSLDRYELSARPFGITYMSIMPKALAKSFQLLCALLVVLAIYARGRGEIGDETMRGVSFPFALTMACQGICFGTISYEYRVVAFLGLVPALVIWLREAAHLSARFRASFAIFFTFFLTAAFRLIAPGSWFSTGDDAAPMIGGDGVERTLLFHSVAMLSLLCCFLLSAKGRAPLKTKRGPA